MDILDFLLILGKNEGFLKFLWVAWLRLSLKQGCGIFRLAGRVGKNRPDFVTTTQMSKTIKYTIG